MRSRTALLPLILVVALSGFYAGEAMAAVGRDGAAGSAPAIAPGATHRLQSAGW